MNKRNSKVAYGLLLIATAAINTNLFAIDEEMLNFCVMNASAGNSEIAISTIRKEPAALVQPNEKGFSPMNAACQNNISTFLDTALATWLGDGKFKPSEHAYKGGKEEYKGWTPAHFAASISDVIDFSHDEQASSVACLTSLYQYSSEDITKLKNTAGETPLDIATKQKNTGAMTFLETIAKDGVWTGTPKPLIHVEKHRERRERRERKSSSGKGSGKGKRRASR